MNIFADLWKDWKARRARLVEFDRADPTEMARVASDLRTSVDGAQKLGGLRRQRSRSSGASNAEPQP